jgi:hypothetical protein
MIPCWVCVDFKTKRCTLREERWAATWKALRRSYPQLVQLEELMPVLMYQHADWASASYWQFVQPWKEWHEAERETWAGLGVEWLAKEWETRGLGWVPTYEPAGIVAQPKRRESRRQWVAELLRLGYTQRRIMAEVGCSEDLVTAVRRTLVAG